MTPSSMRSCASFTPIWRCLLFATILGHLGAALFHGLIYRDGVFTSMMPWRVRAGKAEPSAAAGNLPASDESRPA